MEIIMDNKTEDHICIIKDALNHFPEEWLVRHIPFFSGHYLQNYCYQLKEENKSAFLERMSSPIFDEEIKINRLEIWQKHHTFFKELDQLTEDNRITEIVRFFTTIPFSEVLILLGQRLTPSSVQTIKALPLKRADLKQATLEPYNHEINVSVRSWEKHVGRTDSYFWGVISGSPAERELKVSKIIDSILDNHTWWNVFFHYKHELVFEIREPGGHGLRWSYETTKFIGFVEPFI